LGLTIGVLGVLYIEYEYIMDYLKKKHLDEQITLTSSKFLNILQFNNTWKKFYTPLNRKENTISIDLTMSYKLKTHSQSKRRRKPIKLM
jgi:hypothetical protein